MSTKRKLWLISFLVILLIQTLISSSSANNTSNDNESAQFYDPNWLYSSIAQCSAAIVGIIGALITSKIIMVSGEKSSLLKRKRELEIEIENLLKKNIEKLEYCNKMDSDDAKERIKKFLKITNIEVLKKAGSFEKIWDLYCDFYDKDQLKCNDLHKKEFISLISAEEEKDDREQK